MASNGSFNTNSSRDRNLVFSWVAREPDTNNNQTTIDWTLKGGGPASGYKMTQNIKVTIDGETVFRHTMSSNGQIKLYNGTVVTTGTYTFTHNDEGNRDFTVYVEAGIYDWPVNCTGTATYSLPQIARASAISSAANVVLGNNCAVKWTPKSAAFYYKLGFQLGDWKHSTEVVHPNKTTEFTYTGLTIPQDVVFQIPSDSSRGTMHVYLHTFYDSAGTVQIGNTSSATFEVTVPDDQMLHPYIDVELSPVHSLPEQFNGLYIQGQSKVKGDITAASVTGGYIKSHSMTVGGVSLGEAEQYTSDYLNTDGLVHVAVYATDTRELTGTWQQYIEVIPYQAPKLENVSAIRCNEDGESDESGTYLQIVAKRSYSPVLSGGVQKNFCEIRYRYRRENTSHYSGWETALAADDLSRDEIVTVPLLDGNLLATNTYRVEVQAIDDVGNTALASIVIPTDKVYWHRDGVKNGLGLGKYNEKENSIDSAWDLHMNGNKVTGLPTPEDDTDAVPLGFLQNNIVEEGTSGSWTYCKWSNGRAELWCYGEATYENGNVLASEEFSYPFALTSVFCGIGTLNSYGGNAAESLPWNLKLAYGKDKCKIWVHNSGGGFTENSTVNASVYIVGRWKR